VKISRLEITGFGPFRDEQVVDLDRFAGDGIFLIAGRTGAGKSSILDAICFALYGTTPRYSEGEKRLRSDYAEPGDPTRVALEFEVADGTWRVERSPEYERPAKRGGGTTMQRSSVELFARDGDDWRGIATKEREVAERIGEIVGMNAGQFQQVILLAQGRFARFLLAKNDERLSLLRSLFGTHRFGAYEAALEARRKEAEGGVAEQIGELRALLDQVDELVERAEVDEAGAAPGDGAAGDREAGASVDPDAVPDETDAIDPGAADGAGTADPGAADGAGTAGDPGDGADAPAPAAGADTDEPLPAGRAPIDEWAERIDRVAGASTSADALLATRAAVLGEATEASTAAERADDERRETLDRQRRRDAARASIAALNERRAEIDAARAELDAARRAATARSALDAADRAESADADASAAERRARAQWAQERSAAGEGADGDLLGDDASAVELDDAAAALHTRIGAWEPVRVTESELARDEARIAEKREALVERDAAIAALAARADTLPGHLAAARDNHAQADRTAAQADAVDEHIRALEAQFQAVREVGERTRAYAAADAAVAEAKRVRDAAEHALGELHRRRLAGYSGELAQQLAAGEPCAVCGSVDHPAPAAPADDQPTPEQIDAADADRAGAAAAYEAAVAQRQASDAALRDAQHRSGGRSETEVNGDLLAERQRRTDTEAAARNRDKFAADIAALEAEQAQLSGTRDAAVAARADLAAAIAADEQALAADRAAVAEARGSAASVAERIGAAQRLASRARACADAARSAAHAATALLEARASAASALAGGAFETADDARAAARTAAATAALEARIREADDARGAAERTLAELAEFALPDALVDRDETAAALAAARARFAEATERRAEAAQLASALGTTLARARAAHDRIGERAARAAVIARLANTVAGRAPNDRRMNLETFVLAAELEEIVQAANLRLAAMSDNQYTLRHTDAVGFRGTASGLGIEVFDAHTGRARPPQSLSGGETFLASLALALGLAEVVTSRAGGIRLDTLFIDEGFGSLDAETLEVAMRTLDDLRQGGRTVGLISHVESMKEQVTAQLRVEQTPQGWSAVRAE